MAVASPAITLPEDQQALFLFFFFFPHKAPQKLLPSSYIIWRAARAISPQSYHGFVAQSSSLMTTIKCVGGWISNIFLQ
eukprot:scaffold1276_cov162-Amphora_coffeaeformis.AAC.8